MSIKKGTEARFDMSQLQSSLLLLKGCIRDEQQKAQREVFKSFMAEVLRLDAHDEAFIELEESYIVQLELLANDENPLGERVNDFVHSDFLYSVLTVKNLRYEREIKSFLKNLQTLIKNTTKESSESDMQFIQSFLDLSLKGVANNLDKDESGLDIPQQIVSSLGIPLEQWFKSM
jgi:hypothetical protein